MRGEKSPGAPSSIAIVADQRIAALPCEIAAKLGRRMKPSRRADRL